MAKTHAERGAIRYTDEQKKEILDFIDNYDKEHGTSGTGEGSGLAAACEKFGVSRQSPINWRTSMKKATKKVSLAPGESYSIDFKKKVVAFACDHNEKNGKGGAAAASAKFGPHWTTISGWMGKNPGRAPIVPRGNVRTTKRYTDDEMLEIFEWIDDYDAEHGRGGITAATVKFNVGHMTIRNRQQKLLPGRVNNSKSKTVETMPDFGSMEVAAKLERMTEIQADIHKLTEERDAIDDMLNPLVNEFAKLKESL